jgi:hypothetical protein
VTAPRTATRLETSAVDPFLYLICRMAPDRLVLKNHCCRKIFGNLTGTPNATTPDTFFLQPIAETQLAPTGLRDRSSFWLNIIYPLLVDFKHATVLLKHGIMHHP